MHNCPHHMACLLWMTLSDHRQFAHIAFQHGGEVYTSGHTAMPFGSVASVHAWHRVGWLLTLCAAVTACDSRFLAGSLLKAIARRKLRLAMHHYVDDYFAADRQESIEVATDVFARLVRACMGDSALQAEKLEHGNPLVILGVEVSFTLKEACFWPAPDKVAKWIKLINAALETGNLEMGTASKLAGKLQWSTQSIFRKIGRAMIRPLFDHIREGKTSMSPQLILALSWWVQTLSAGIRQAALRSARSNNAPCRCVAQGSSQLDSQ